MPIALSPIQSSQNLKTALIHADGGNGGGRPAETRARSSAGSPAADKDIPTKDRITLSPKIDLAAGTYVPAAPYAEIWKNGRKVAEIDSRGEVSVFDGVVAAHPAVGSGLKLAAQRAALIASSIGGEIRVGGMVTDAPTLAMKARLSETYK
ncbi:MAG: hypothetical protein D4S02_17180 [Rhodocyclaceae bacterium]|nr:MAG: hypothetical protein D4S02_17180 [Rhodocyclaceae bacterium]